MVHLMMHSDTRDAVWASVTYTLVSYSVIPEMKFVSHSINSISHSVILGMTKKPTASYRLYIIEYPISYFSVILGRIWLDMI